MGLCAASSNIYIWGNAQYLCDQAKTENCLTPTLFEWSVNRGVRDIECNNNLCVAIADRGAVFIWGKFVSDMHDGLKKNNVLNANSATSSEDSDESDSESNSDSEIESSV